MKIKVQRSGGIAGIFTSCEMDTEKLPALFENTVRDLLGKRKLPLTMGSIKYKDAADYFTYKITIQDGTKHSTVECDQFNLKDDLRSLIRFVESNSKK